MTERASVFEALQIGVEGTPGTEADANKRIEGWGLTPNRVGSIDTFRPEGLKFATLATIGKQQTEASLDGILSYNDVIFPLAGLVSYATPADDGGTPNGYTWTFTPDTDAPDTVKTYTMEFGSSARAHQFEYGQFTGWGFSLSGNDSQVATTGSVLGQELRDGITKTSSPTTIEAVPAHPKQCVVKLASTQAGLSGATALTRLLNLEWNYTGKYGPVNTISSETSFTATVELAGELTGSMTVEADAEGSAFLVQAAAGTQYWMSITFTGGVIHDAVTYSFALTMPFVFTSFGEVGDSDGVVALTYNFTGVHDQTWGKAFQIAVVNTVAAIT